MSLGHSPSLSLIHRDHSTDNTGVSSVRLDLPLLLVPRRDARDRIAEEPAWGEACIYSIVRGWFRWLRDLGWVNPGLHLLFPWPRVWCGLEDSI